jgi:putative transposase
MPNQVKRSRQQEMPFRTHGGARKGAGRKRRLPGRPKLRHEARPEADARRPEHITLRMRSDVPRLRNYELCQVLRRAFVYGCRKGGEAGEFRICQFSIQGNHIHLVCEATSSAARARGIQGFCTRVARGIHRFFGRTGRVFDDRYHVEVLKTPSQVRHALCYVLQNARRHGIALDRRYHGADPFSSAWWFDGWRDASWKDGLDPPEQRTVAGAESWLLRGGWSRAKGGRIAIDEVPAAARRAKRECRRS